MLQARRHFVGYEGAEHEDAVFYVTQEHPVFASHKAMVAPVVAHRATCQLVVLQYVSVGVVIQEVLNNVNALLIDVQALCIAVEDVWQKYRLTDKRFRANMRKICRVAAFLASQCHDTYSVIAVVVSTGARHTD